MIIQTEQRKKLVQSFALSIMVSKSEADKYEGFI